MNVLIVFLSERTVIDLVRGVETADMIRRLKEKYDWFVFVLTLRAAQSVMMDIPRIRNALEKLSVDFKLLFCPAYDPEAIVAIAEGLYEELRGCKITIDVTGGSELMAAVFSAYMPEAEASQYFKPGVKEKC